MKSTFTLCLFLLASLCGFSQNQATASGITIELPIRMNFGEQLTFSRTFQVRARYFYNDQTAFRLGFRLNNQSNVQRVQGLSATEEGTVKNRYTQFGLAPGIEWHFGNSERVRPYIGLELPFEFNSAKQTYTQTDGDFYDEDINFVIEGAQLDEWGDITQRSQTSAGFRAVLGWDIYFLGPAYLGFETGFGLISTRYREVEYVDADGSFLVSTSSSTTDFGDSVFGNIRLGIVLR